MRIISVQWGAVLQRLLIVYLLSCNVSYAGFVGINTNEVLPVDASLPFTNLFKVSMPFGQSNLTRGKVDFDEQGWVSFMHEKARAGAYFLKNIPMDALPKGQYVVRYDGVGKLGYGGGARVVARQPGRDVITLRSGAGNLVTAWIYLEDTHPLNYIKNIRIMMPGGICKHNPFIRVKHASECQREENYLSFEDNADTLLFNPAYLRFMKDFRTIRFMSMSGITRNPLEFWEGRPKITDATWSGGHDSRGVPLEVMIRLANQLNARPWFNIPHRANNHFVREYAKLVKKLLKPHLKPYIEYTNEAWNPIFIQAHYVDEMGRRQALDPDKEKAGSKFYSKRSVEIFRIWQSVFGSRDRFTSVLSGFAGYPKLTKELLMYNDAYKFTDVFAIAPYFYVKGKYLKKVRSVDDVFDLLLDDTFPHSVNNEIKRISQHAAITQELGVELVAYEGGQHLVVYSTKKKTEHPNPILIEANSDVRMEQLYLRFLEGWRNAGGGLFMAFSSPRTNEAFGFWGVKEHINQALEFAPKYRALIRYAR